MKNRDSPNDYEEIIEILKMQRDGKSVRDIAELLDMAKSTAQRRLDKAKKCNITIPEDTTESVPHVGQAGQAESPSLPFKEEEN